MCHARRITLTSARWSPILFVSKGISKCISEQNWILTGDDGAISRTLFMIRINATPVQKLRPDELKNQMLAHNQIR